MTQALAHNEINQNWTQYWSSVEGRSKTHRVASNVVSIQSHSGTQGSEIAFLGLIVVALQVLDGILTGLGMFHFGTDMEGNALLRGLMEAVGFIPALIIVKSSAIAVVSALCIFAYRIWWLKVALRGVIGLYLTMAVAPWCVILTANWLA